MAADQRARLVRLLAERSGWTTGTELAQLLGVSTRTVRSYASALDAVVERSHEGYRVRPDVDPAVALQPALEGEVSPVRMRRRRVAAVLLNRELPIHIDDLGDSFGVSRTTVETDLAELRSSFAEHQLELLRRHDVVEVVGAERDRRRMIRDNLHASLPGLSMLDLGVVQGAFPDYDVRELKGALTESIDRRHLDLNDYAAQTIVLHLLVALQRLTADQPLSEQRVPARDDPRVHGVVADLASYLEAEYGVDFDANERAALAAALSARTTLLGGYPSSGGDAGSAPSSAELVRTILDDVSATYLVDLDDDKLVTTLGLHLDSLIARAREGTFTANPMAPAVRDSHPLVYELAVFMARRVEELAGIHVHPDEIGFLAFHVGGIIERERDRAVPDLVTVLLVCVGYRDQAKLQADRLRDALGAGVEVTTVTGLDHDLTRTHADLVVAPVPPPGVDTNRVVVIGPLLGPHDIDAVVDAVRRHRARQGLSGAIGQLAELLDPNLFFARVDASTREQLLPRMVGALRAAGIVGEGFLDEVLEREAMAPTAFRQTVAVPHAMRMTANRTAICVATAPGGVDWGGVAVQLVVLVAFSPHDRRAFRDLFDQLIIAVSEPGNVARLVRFGTTHEQFVDELTRLIDAQ